MASTLFSSFSTLVVSDRPRTFEWENYVRVPDKAKKTHCSKEFVVDFKNGHPMRQEVSDRKPPPMTTCSYDLETSRLNANDDYILQVSMIFARLSDSGVSSNVSGSSHTPSSRMQTVS